MKYRINFVVFTLLFNFKLPFCHDFIKFIINWHMTFVLEMMKDYYNLVKLIFKLRIPLQRQTLNLEYHLKTNLKSTLEMSCHESALNSICKIGGVSGMLRVYQYKIKNISVTVFNLPSLTVSVLLLLSFNLLCLRTLHSVIKLLLLSKKNDVVQRIFRILAQQ